MNTPAQASRCPRTTWVPTARRRRSVAVVTALLAGGLVGTAAPARADLAAVSPTIVDGVPQHYRDTRGVSLELCLDTPLCITPAAEFTAPNGEAFYHQAFAEIAGITAELSLEAAFVNGAPIVFQRTQYQAPPGMLLPGATYTITDPYGSMSCVGNTDTGATTRCRFESGGEGSFAGALSGRIGPFLTAVNAPAGHLGDNATPVKVTGSPIGFNTFRIQGPGLPAGTCGPGCLQTDLWVVQGRLDPDVTQPAPVPETFLSTSSLDFGAHSISAGPTAARTVRILNNGTAPMTGVAVSSTSSAFTVASSCPGTLAQASECAAEVRFDPAARGAQAGALTVTSNAGTATVALAGQATQAILAAPRTVRFGSSGVGSRSTWVLRLDNVGDAPLLLGHLRVSGPHRRSFRLTGPPQRCTSGQVVAAGAFCRLAVTFRPQRRGRMLAALRMLADGVPASTTLKGRGVRAGDRSRPTAAIDRPERGARGVSRRTDVVVRFDERVQGVSRDTFVLIDLSTGERVDARLSRRGRTVALHPSSPLARRRTYEARLKGHEWGIRDLSGNPLRSVAWQFTTRGR